MLKGIHASHGVRVKNIDIAEFNFQFACQIYIVIHHACQWSKATYLLSAAVTRLRSPSSELPRNLITYRTKRHPRTLPIQMTYLWSDRKRNYGNISRDWLWLRISERFYYFATIISHFSTLYMTEESFIYFVSKGEIIAFA